MVPAVKEKWVVHHLLDITQGTGHGICCDSKSALHHVYALAVHAYRRETLKIIIQLTCSPTLGLTYLDNEGYLGH